MALRYRPNAIRAAAEGPLRAPRGGWEDHLTAILRGTKLGGIPVPSHPSTFWFPKWALLLTVYVDDLMLSGPEAAHSPFWDSLIRKVKGSSAGTTNTKTSRQTASVMSCDYSSPRQRRQRRRNRRRLLERRRKVIASHSAKMTRDCLAVA